MAYNVFKRPMFKRGGSTTGTGIMSHVEPRINAAMGFPNFGVTQMPPQSQLDAFRQAEVARQNRLSKDFNILGPAFTMPKDFPGTVNDYRNFLREQEKSMMTDKNISGGIAQLQPGQTAFDAVFAPVDLEMAKQKAEKQKLLEDKPDPGKDEPAYEGTDIKSEVRKESEMLRELLKDDKYSRGEAALIIAGALAEPGSFSDKIKKATELAAPVARRTREEDKAITLAAYKLAKEKEQQQIKAGTLPKELMYVKEQARLLAKEKGTTEEQEYKNLIIQDATLDMATKRAVDTLLTPQGIGETNKLINTIKDARRRRAEAVSKNKDTAKIDKELEEYMSEFETLKNTKGFAIAFPQYMNFKEGGRVKRALGSDEDGETSDIISSQVSFTPETTTKDSMTDETVVEKPVENLTFAELRDRLPPEITDDVVQMLASSEEALQDFAYIRTQQDINQFNVKYGVNLVIPPTQA
jgi:hypothetical protein